MYELLFENPLPVYVVLGLAEIVIAGLWFRGRTRRLATALAIPPLVALAVLACDLLVETDREKLGTMLHEVAADVQRGDLEAAGRHVADDCTGFYGTRDETLATGQKLWKEYGIGEVSLSRVEINVNSGVAVIHARSTVAFSRSPVGGGTAVLDWTLHCGLRGGEWKIASVAEPKVVGFR